MSKYDKALRRDDAITASSYEYIEIDHSMKLGREKKRLITRKSRVAPTSKKAPYSLLRGVAFLAS